MVEARVILDALWVFLPAYFSNMAPVFAAKMLPRWNAAMDAGKNHADGRRLLGPSKTWRGLVAGSVVGGVTALTQALLGGPLDGMSDFGRSTSGTLAVPLLVGLLLGAGAILGDTVESYAKRRRGRPAGSPWVPFDQLDFVVGGLLVAALAGLLLMPLLDTNWFLDAFVRGDAWPIIPILLVLTPLLHVIVNGAGFLLRLKKVPW